ncbi:MAG: hypothetical protein ABI792_02785 [bacterium]
MNSFNNNSIVLTFDTDWAPDFAIRQAAELLISKDIKCTWFITHRSDYIEELYRHKDIFEFGIHPNFFEDSTQGNNENEVLKYICSIVPEAKAVRTHALHQSSRILSKMTDEFGIETDCSLLLYLTKDITPHRIYFRHNSRGIFRIPYFWEDDIHMYDPNPDWDIVSPVYHSNGLKIFNFHPLLTYLNSETMYSYENLKLKKSLPLIQEEEMDAYINKDNSKGAGVFLKKTIDFIKNNNIKTYTMADLKNQYNNIKNLSLHNLC